MNSNLSRVQFIMKWCDEMAWWIQVQHLIATISIRDVFDIFIVAFVFYQIYRMIRDTRALAVAMGILVLLLITLISWWLNLHVISWLLQKTIGVVLVALPIVFQPELRRALEKLGRVPLVAGGDKVNQEEADNLIKELSNAAGTLSKNSIGALIVLEQEVGLSDYSETGIAIDGVVSSSLLINVFIPNTPLHDGAVIVRNGRVLAAGCLLPLSQEDRISKELGTRHRAALGMSEHSDAIVIVVSEETGTLSVAHHGELFRLDNVTEFRDLLQDYLTLPKEKMMERFKRFFLEKGGSKGEGK